MSSITSKHLIIIVVTILVFLNLTIYLPFINLFPLPAYILDIIILTILWGYYLKSKHPFPYKNKILFWIFYYVILTFSYFILSPEGSAEFAYIKVFFFLLIVMSYLLLLFELDTDNLQVTRKTLVFIAPITTYTLMVDYFDPAHFYYGKSIVNYVEGRASSLFLNANLAGAAMLTFLIFGIDMITKKLRIWFIITIFLGLFFTMSRSNLMIFFILLSVMFFQKKLYGRHLLLSLTSIILFFSWLSTGGLDYFAEHHNLHVTENMKSRVNFFADNKDSDTHDMDERKEVLIAALNLFQNKPLLGNGFISTRLWEYDVSPHNTIAMFLADYGFFGLLMYPILFLFSTYDIFKYGEKRDKQLAWLFILFFLFSSFFSHNMLEIPFLLATIILISTIGYKAKNRFLREIK